MSEVQFYISVAVMPVTTIVIVLIGVLLSNQRITALENTFNAWLTDQREMLRSEIARVESVLLSKFAELDQRLSRLEARMAR
jgi:Tfp pilus assembly protein PilN